MPLTYKWTRNGEPIAGAISPTYTLTPADADKTILCEVTGENGICSVMVATNSVVTPGLAPINTIPPVISGLPTEGQTLTVTNNGTWTGAPTIVFTYQWRRNGVDIPLALTSSYVLTSTDIGTVIDCVVTGTNLYGTDDAASNYFIPCGGAAAPDNTVAPAVTYSALTVGSILNCSQGTWIGSTPITYSYQWQRDGVDLVGETTNAYTIVSGDVGRNIRCIVTGTNVVTPIDASSNVVVPVASPAFVTTPVIYGDETVGSILTCSPGTISGTSPITISYNWQYSTDGGTTWNNYSPVKTLSTYQIISADLNCLIRCQVSASNAYSPTANSVSNSLLIAQAPVNTVAPGISGGTFVGGVLTANTGTWDGTPTITYGYQWQRNGVDISGANTNSYTVVTADIGTNITVKVAATNAVTTNYAESSAVIPVSAPISIQPPVIYGSGQVGNVLTVQDGYYGGYPSSSISRKWQYSTNGGVSWVDYSPAEIGTTYTVQSGDIGRIIRVFETANNGYGTPTQTSNTVSVISTNVGPIISGTPTVSGVKIVGQTLTGNIAPLTITGSPTPSVTYQWYNNDVPISLATSISYTLTTADVGANITLRVTATNSSGAAYVVSAVQVIFMTIADKYPTLASFGWNMFLLKGSYYGSPILQVRRASDNTTQNIGVDVNGYLDVGAISTFCSGTSGFVSIFYDQLGGAHYTQTNTALQFRIFASGAIDTQNLIACLNATATTMLMSVVGSAAAGTFNFLHDGTTNYTVYTISTAANSQTNIIATQSGTALGIRITWGLNNNVSQIGYNSTAQSICSQTSPNSFTTTNKQYITVTLGSLTSGFSAQRMRTIINDLFIATNGQGNTPSTGNPSTDLQLGGGGVNRFQGVLIYKTQANFAEIRNLLISQYNIAM